MIGTHLNKDQNSSVSEALRQIRATASIKEPILAGTHNLYKYPACFHPKLTRAIIRSFSQPGDTILDPYMGGGTTAVEALSLGRSAAGIDLNELALFSTRMKTTFLDAKTILKLNIWVDKVMTGGGTIRSTIYPDEYFKGIRNSLCREIFRIERSIRKINSPKLNQLARAILLNTAKIAIDNKEIQRTMPAFRSLFLEQHERLLQRLLFFAQSSQECWKNLGLVTKPKLHLQGGDTVDSKTIEKLSDRLGGKRLKLLITSPPYPGVSVLYNRWQVRGRIEVSLPYWIINKPQHIPSSEFTMGYPKSATGLERYYKSIEGSFFNLRSVLKKDALVVQIVAFSNVREQLPRFIESMNAAGYSEIGKYSSLLGPEGRIWRTIRNRRWYNKDASRRREAVLFFRRR